MATTVTKVIDPDSGSGYDYDSLFDWEAAQQGDLTGVRDEIAIAKCRCTSGTADSTLVVVDGWTTSATQYIKIWTDPSENYRHSGVWSNSKYRLAVTATTDTNLLTVSEDYTRVEGLQLWIDSSTNGITLRGLYCIAETARFKNCIVRGNEIVGSTYGFYQKTLKSTVEIINCLFYYWYTNGIFYYCNDAGTVTDWPRIYNCTVVHINFYGYNIQKRTGGDQ